MAQGINKHKMTIGVNNIKHKSKRKIKFNRFALLISNKCWFNFIDARVKVIM